MAELRAAAGRKLRPLPVLRRYPTTFLTSALEGYRLRHDFETVRTFVLFVGQPRTGHSLVGALLDAHPRTLIAHELDALKYVAAGYDRRQLFALLVKQERARVAAGHVSGVGYAYAVPGQWQGRYQRLEVIGDKKGGRSTLRLREDMGLLDRLAATVDVEVKVIQVVRSPYDVIATMHRRAPRRALGDVVTLFFDLADTAADVRARLDASCFHELHLEDLVADPVDAMVGLCRFLDLHPSSDYLDACRRLVFDVPRRTRHEVEWTPELLASIAERSSAHPSLRRYELDDTAGEPR